jgi:hypothetical protein
LLCVFNEEYSPSEKFVHFILLATSNLMIYSVNIIMAEEPWLS